MSDKILEIEGLIYMLAGMHRLLSIYPDKEMEREFRLLTETYGDVYEEYKDDLTDEEHTKIANLMVELIIK